MVMLVPVASHDQKSNFTPHFDCLDLRNTMVPLIMLLLSCSADAKLHACDVRCVIGPKVMQYLVLVVVT